MTINDAGVALRGPSSLDLSVVTALPMYNNALLNLKHDQTEASHPIFFA